MHKSLRLRRTFVISMAFILPLWLVVGRGLFGVGGWGMIAIVLGVAPILLICLLLLGLLTKSNRGINAKAYLSKIDSILLTLIYIFVFLFGFFLVDGGDTEQSVNSVATKLLGRSILDISETLSMFFMIASAVIIVSTFVVLIIKRFNHDNR